nr:NACHT domain-containing protein [Bacteroidota bacterium]
MLENRLLDINENIYLDSTQAFKSLCEAHLSAYDLQRESLNFVPLEGSWFANSEHSFHLDEEINKFLASDRKVLLLLGDSGAGKSLYTQGLVNKLWQTCSSQDPIPLWISLPALKNPVDNLVQEYFKQFGFTDTQINSLQKNQSFVFILDAYDEIRILKNLYVTNQLGNWKAKIIMTCRREYLYSVDNYKLYFAPFHREKAQYHAYTEIIVKPFKENQIEQYLQQYVKNQETEWKDWRQYQKSIETIS